MACDGAPWNLVLGGGVGMIPLGSPGAKGKGKGDGKGKGIGKGKGKGRGKGRGRFFFRPGPESEKRESLPSFVLFF